MQKNGLHYASCQASSRSDSAPCRIWEGHLAGPNPFLLVELTSFLMLSVSKGHPMTFGKRTAQMNNKRHYWTVPCKVEERGVKRLLTVPLFCADGIGTDHCEASRILQCSVCVAGREQQHVAGPDVDGGAAALGRRPRSWPCALVGATQLDRGRAAHNAEELMRGLIRLLLSTPILMLIASGARLDPRCGSAHACTCRIATMAPTRCSPAASRPRLCLRLLSRWAE